MVAFCNGIAVINLYLIDIKFKFYYCTSGGRALHFESIIFRTQNRVSERRGSHAFF